MMKTKNKKTSSSRLHLIFPVLKQTFQAYFKHGVGKNAAALAYYLLFALFPMLIFVSNLVGLMHINQASIIDSLQRFLPTEVLSLITSYLSYIGQTSSKSLLMFSLVFSIWFPMRAIRGLMSDIRTAYDESAPTRPVLDILKQFICTLVFLFAVVVVLFLSATGPHVLRWIDTLLPHGSVPISEYLLSIWQYVRFLLAALMMYFCLATLYALSLNRRPSFRQTWPGIILAMISWMIVSIAFSLYVENFSNYSVIYGTLGAVMVLMIWLYLSSMIFILGGEINGNLFLLHKQEMANQSSNNTENEIQNQ